MVVGVVTLAGPAAALNAASTPKWITDDSTHHTATLTVTAGYGGGFDFNGYAHGKMTVTVPVNFTVDVVFSNKTTIPHSVVFTPYTTQAKLIALSSFPVAFKGSASPKPMDGITSGKTQKFSFKADKVGVFAFVCAVPGHAAAGMWDAFKVVKSGSPSVTTSK